VTKQEEQFERERVFHDDWANSIRVEDVQLDSVFEGPAALENKWILGQLGDLKGKRVLDLGCGLGEASVYFAKKGAIVTASDLSPQMLEFTQ